MGVRIALVRPFIPIALLFLATLPAGAQDRGRVGVAFGGGSARGLAHVGVIRWMEEHHVPIDLTAGTSMGGLVAGFFATGMPSAELERLLHDMDWNTVFASSTFQFKNVRRKSDARSFPSGMQFGLKDGLKAPASPNTGQPIDRLLNRIAGPYYGVASFDELPTPLRLVAVDLLTARPVILDRGSLPLSLRATMAFPGIFQPVPIDGRVLVDGGVLNNDPADVVRAMGAAHVIAVNVNDLSDRHEVNYSVFGLMGAALDAMVRSHSRRSLAAADVVVNVPVEGFAALDFSKSGELIEIGYQAAAAMRDQLLRYAVSDDEWASWVEHRRLVRRTSAIVPASVEVHGLAPGEARRLRRRLAYHVGQPLDPAAIDQDLAGLSALDRYELISWSLAAPASGAVSLQVQATEYPYSPPYLMLGLNLENTTSDQFRVSVSSRYLAFDAVSPGSELRLDATAGSDPGAGASLFVPFAGAAFFSPYGSLAKRTFSVVERGADVAQYGTTEWAAGLDFGLNLGRDSDVRLGASMGHLNASVHVGNPELPGLKGQQTSVHVSWRLDTQDRAVVPTKGIIARASVRHLLEGARTTEPGASGGSKAGTSLVTAEANRFWTINHHDRLFALAGGGASMRHRPLTIDRFALGSPMHLGAYRAGELTGDHYLIATAGYLRQLTRLPEFLGGPMFAGAWVEAGDAFDDRRELSWRTNISGGFIMDTLVGQLLLATSYGSGSRWRAYVSVGPLFR
jgi:NTE family protein